jgi:hypothetical protein
LPIWNRHLNNFFATFYFKRLSLVERNRMKYLIVLLFCCSAILVNAQKTIFRISTGYGFAAPGAVTNYSRLALNESRVTKSNYGSGPSVMAEAAFRVVPRVYFTTGLQYGPFAKVKYGVSFNDFEEETTHKTKSLFVSGGIKYFISNPKATTRFYSGASLIVPVAATIKEEKSQLSFGRPFEIKSTIKLAHTLGYCADFGVESRIGKNIYLHGNLRLNQQHIFYKKETRTSYITNGRETIQSIPVHQKEFIYKKKYNPSSPFDPNQPTIELAPSVPFSNIGIFAGITIVL